MSELQNDAFDRGRRTGLDIAALVAESMGYFATARAIRSAGNSELLEALLRERARTVVASSTRMAGAFCALMVERRAQEHAWPGEELLDGTGDDNARELAAIVKRWVDGLNGTPNNTFAHVLVEEVMEALAEKDLDALRKEVVQVGAVAVKWIEDIDRRMRR
jgi:hypothetical protein